MKKYLTKEYLANDQDKIDFAQCKIKIVNFSNNKIHRLIKTTQNIAYKITDPDKIKKINEIKSKEFEKINKKRNYLQSNDPCLLNQKFLKLGKTTLISIFVKKGKSAEKIPVKIIKNTSFGYYLIKISVDFNHEKFNLSKGEEYIVDARLLKKIKEDTWNAIISKYSPEKIEKQKNKRKVKKII